MSATERPRDFINIEDLLCRSERKTHQKTYRNRNRHGKDAETTPQTSSSPPKGLSNGDPAPPIHVAGAEDQAKAAGTAQESRKRNGRHKNGCDIDDLNSVKYKAAQQTKHPRHAPGKVINPVKSAEGSSLSRRARDHSGSNADGIESQASRRPNEVPRANEVRKRKSLSELRQTIKLPTHNGINVSDFKFPSTPTPQTPKASKFSNWTPGSGFDHIPFSFSTDLGKRHRRVRRIDSLSGSGLKLANRSRSQAVCKKISGSHPKQDIDGGALGILDLDSFRQNVTKSVHLPDEFQNLSNPPSADVVNESEEQHSRHDVCRQEQALPPISTNDDRQNHQDPNLIGEALAEALNDSSSIPEEDSRNAAEASCLNVTAECTTEETDRHTAGCTTDVITKSTTCPSDFFSYFEYLHTSPALQDAPTHDTSWPPQTEAPVDQVFFPYYASSSPPSSAVAEAEACETEHSGKDNSRVGADSEEATGSNQHMCQSHRSDEEVGWEMLEEEEEEAEDEMEGDHPDLPRQSMTGDGGVDAMLDDVEEPKGLNQRPSQTQTQNNIRLPNAFEPELTWQGFSPVGHGPGITPFAQDPPYYHLHRPNIDTSSPAPHSSPPLQPKTLLTITLTSDAYFTKAVEQLSSPSKAPRKLPSRKSQGRPTSHRAKEEGVLHLGVSPSLKRKLSKIPFRPPLLASREDDGEGEAG
ncbi:phospholipase [Physcia stellaris]|nr:phospholipase [Physcia stellaris]